MQYGITGDGIKIFCKSQGNKKARQFNGGMIACATKYDISIFSPRGTLLLWPQTNQFISDFACVLGTIVSKGDIKEAGLLYL